MHGMPTLSDQIVCRMISALSAALHSLAEISVIDLTALKLIRQTECICFADSAMIMHVVYRRAQKFLHAASRIYRALRTMHIAARW